MRVAAVIGLAIAVVACMPTAPPASADAGPGVARQEAKVVASPHPDAPVSVPAPEVDLDISLGDFDLSQDVRRDWLRKDLQAIGRFAPLFPLHPLEETLAAFETTDDTCTPIEHGFGIEVRWCALPGGYTTCAVQLISHEGVVFEAEARCSASERSWSSIEAVIGKAYETALVPKGFSVELEVASLSIRDDVVRDRAMASIAKALGPRSGAVVPPELAEPFALLDSPSETLTIGTACGAGGSPPEGNRAMQQLVDATREDLLRDVMHGMNAGGRIYGYIGLRLLGRNTAADDRAFDRLKALELEVETCSGCSSTRQTAKAIDLARFRRVVPR
jgi:hypothetical protein